MIQVRFHGRGGQGGVIKLDPAGAYACAIDLDYCKGCGLCVQECPCGAIKIDPEEV
jgi:Pyruvate/2-oxoacid:ferredoxin oxidoreductase delta subunit